LALARVTINPLTAPTMTPPMSASSMLGSNPKRCVATATIPANPSTDATDMSKLPEMINIV
jgi:hypothetical protein